MKRKQRKTAKPCVDLTPLAKMEVGPSPQQTTVVLEPMPPEDPPPAIAPDENESVLLQLNFPGDPPEQPSGLDVSHRRFA